MNHRALRSTGLRVEIPVNIKRRAPKVAKQESPRDNEHGDVPRNALLLALAHKWEGMVRRGEANCGELARHHGLSRARVTQICSLMLLAPEIQDHMLNRAAGSKCLSRSEVRRIARQPVWSSQLLAHLRWL